MTANARSAVMTFQSVSVVTQELVGGFDFSPYEVAFF
jgi:hypothetical protein